MEHFAQVVEQIDFRIATIKFDIKEIETHLHEQLNAGVSEEHLSHYYSKLDEEEGKLSGLGEALSILKSALCDYREREPQQLIGSHYGNLSRTRE